MSKELTRQQELVFRWIFESTMRNGYQPSMRELQLHFDLSSPNGTMCHMRALQKKGYIRLGKGQSRANRFLRCPDGSKFCGFICKGVSDEEARVPGVPAGQGGV
jgi:SOS-response transcriptional repressor LexA